MGQVRVAILDDQPSSQLLHLETVQRSLRIQILRALPADKMRRVGHSASNVPVRDAANFCGGQMDERAASASPRTVLALQKYNMVHQSFDIGSAVNRKLGKARFQLISQWISNCVPQIPRGPRPVPRVSVVTLLLLLL